MQSHKLCNSASIDDTRFVARRARVRYDKESGSSRLALLTAKFAFMSGRSPRLPLHTGFSLNAHITVRIEMIVVILT